MSSEFVSELIQRMDDIEGVTLPIASDVQTTGGQAFSNAGAVVRYLDGSWGVISASDAEALLNDPRFRRSDRQIRLNTTGKALQE